MSTFNRKVQNTILERLKSGKAFLIEKLCADNITRANYADFLWPEWSVDFRSHFMFHVDSSFMGFSSGEKMTADHDEYGHCCYCGDSIHCSNFRIIDSKQAHFNKTK